MIWNYSELIPVVITLAYVGLSYPREIWLALKNQSSMSVAFQLAATATFASWVWYATHGMGDAQSNTSIGILIPNSVGMIFAAALTAILWFKKKNSSPTEMKEE